MVRPCSCPTSDKLTRGAKKKERACRLHRVRKPDLCTADTPARSAALSGHAAWADWRAVAYRPVEETL